MNAEIHTYRQKHPADYLKNHPDQTWRCDIWPGDGLTFHGIGKTEAEALWNAASAYFRDTIRSEAPDVRLPDDTIRLGDIHLAKDFLG